MDHLHPTLFDHRMSNHQSLTSLTLVISGTGKTGRRVAQRLQEGGHRVRATYRAAREPAFDWDDPSTWPAVVRGCTAAYVTYSPDVAFPGAAEKIGSFAETAVAAGVERLVLLSGRGEHEAEVSERAVRTVKADCTILRCSWFSQNFSEDFLFDPVLDGVIALPAGQVAEPFVDADDIADVAVAALTETGTPARRTS